MSYISKEAQFPDPHISIHVGPCFNELRLIYEATTCGECVKSLTKWKILFSVGMFKVQTQPINGRIIISTATITN